MSERNLELENARWQINYMCEEIAAALGLPVQTPAETVQSVRDLMSVAGSGPELLTVIRGIAAMTDADDPNSYRSDSGEDCLDAVYAAAREAVLKVSGESGKGLGEA